MISVVVARGTESLMANEVRSQKIDGFLQTASNPSLAPFAKFNYIIREIAKAMDLDPDKVTNNMDEAKVRYKQKYSKVFTTAQAGGAVPPRTAISRC